MTKQWDRSDFKDWSGDKGGHVAIHEKHGLLVAWFPYQC
jgi:hypothetical protein